MKIRGQVGKLFPTCPCIAVLIGKNFPIPIEIKGILGKWPRASFGTLLFRVAKELTPVFYGYLTQKER